VFSPTISLISLLLYFLDPIFQSLFPDILQSLAASTNPGVYETVVKHALPFLCSAIANTPKEQSWTTASAIDLVTSLVKGAGERPIGDGFFAMLAPNLFKCLNETEDKELVQVQFFVPFTPPKY
jgi:importin-9